jgi:anthranilate phosphoribosyltransferase
MEFGDAVTRNAIQKLVSNHEISEKELKETFDAIMAGRATSAQSAAFIIMLKMRGETARELAVLSQVANDYAEPCFRCEDAVDIVGTGGDGLGTFNISTAAALIVAGAGVRVIKV